MNTILNMKSLIIELLIINAIISAILVIIAKNPVISVIFLISVFINAAGYLILLGIGFIGISYIIVYVGAITVLFLFVVMLINIRLSDILEVGSQYTKNLPIAIGISSLFAYEIFTIIPISFNNISSQGLLLHLQNILHFINGLVFSSETFLSETVYIVLNPTIADSIFTNFTQIQVLGQYLYSTGAYLLIISSIILLLALVAPIFITKK